jgi:hypothetical protein
MIGGVVSADRSTLARYAAPTKVAKKCAKLSHGKLAFCLSWHSPRLAASWRARLSGFLGRLSFGLPELHFLMPLRRRAQHPRRDLPCRFIQIRFSSHGKSLGHPTNACNRGRVRGYHIRQRWTCTDQMGRIRGDVRQVILHSRWDGRQHGRSNQGLWISNHIPWASGFDARSRRGPLRRADGWVKCQPSFSATPGPSRRHRS